jgi:hypothetical protein
MKKLLVLLVLVLVPMISFADFQIGPTAMYNFTFYDANLPPVQSLSISNFTFGADARLNFGILQGSAYGLVTPGSVDVAAAVYNPTILKLYTDLGICLDVLILRLSAGIGPNFNFYFADPSAPTKPDIFQLGLNLKLAADINFGSIALSVVYFTDTNLTAQGVAQAFQKINGNLGLSLLFKLF